MADETHPGAQLPDPARVGAYAIEARVATGHVTTVYRARDTRNNAPVALHLLGPKWSDDSRVVDRFFRACELAMNFNHPALPVGREIGKEPIETAGGELRPFATYNFIDGDDLARVLGRDGPLSPKDVVRIMLQVADALEASGVPHGDLKPRHLLRAKTGGLKVIGFLPALGWRSVLGHTLHGDAAYMAPEVSRGQRVDVRADIYSLGCAAYELMCAKTPFGSGSPNALVACHHHEPFPRLSVEIGPAGRALDELLRAMCAKAANRRPQTWTALKPMLIDLEGDASASAPGPILHIEVGRQRGTPIVLPEGELLLGRAEEGFVIDDGQISRRHAVVTRAGDAVSIKDLGSRNGVRVNEVLTREVALKPGDRVQLGDTVFVLKTRHSEVDTGELPASPLRGAFGLAEIVHGPAQQLDLNAPPPLTGRDLILQRNVLTSVGQLLAQDMRGPRAMRDGIQSVLAANLSADGALFVPVENGTLAYDARTTAEANALSRALPAIERAIPGSVALRTSVRVGRDEATTILCAPVIGSGGLEALLVVLGPPEHLDEGALRALESASALLTLRAKQSVAGEST